MHSIRNSKSGAGKRVWLFASAASIIGGMPTHVMAQAAATPADLAAQGVAAAQPTDAPDVSRANEAQRAAAGDIGGVGDIVVTARREAENVQHVPVSVQVVTGDTLKKLSIVQSTEISKLAPGLNLNQPTPNPDNLEIVLRGVRWTTASGTPAIPTYLNDVPFDPASVITALYDIGQIEVLRGPQGTTRGAPSIAGAITYVTQRPDLNTVGGYAYGQAGTHDHQDFQGAIGIPIIQDKLAIRLAGTYDHSEGNQVRSLYDSTKPYFRTWSGRATVLFQPTDTLSFTGMYQRLDQKGKFYQAVAGPGSPGFAALGIPANFNSPAISAKDYRSVQDVASTADRRTTLVTLNASWEVLGQRLSYNFGLQNNPASGAIAVDLANVVPGFDVLPTGGSSAGGYRVHELRLSSIRGGRFFDYDLGFYRQVADGKVAFGVPAFLPGAFGAPFVSPPGQVTTPISRYTLQANSLFRLKTDNYSFYGNLQLHLSPNDELSGGVRWIHDRRPVRLDVTTSEASIAFARFLPAAAGGCPSPFLPDSLVYGPAYCDFTLPAGSTSDSPGGKTYTPVIYNASYSHRFGDAVLAYATVGSSFRQGLPSINNPGLPSQYVVPKPERATSYEVGVKTTLSRAVRVNVDIFQIDYKNQLNQFQNIPYYNSLSQSIGQTSIAFYTNVDARVRGLEAEVFTRPFRNFTLNGNLSYSKIQSRGGSVPCDQQATNPVSAANPINFCSSRKGATINSSPPFQATINGSYDVPLGNVDGYFRFNVNHVGTNPAFGVSDVGFHAKAYTLVDLFAGVTGQKGGWDLGVYAKNVLQKKITLESNTLLNTIYPLFAAPTGLSSLSLTQPREIGVTLRYAFGSR